MKKYIQTILCMAALSSCSAYQYDFATASCTYPDQAKGSYKRAEALQNDLNELVKNGVPGTSLAIISEDGLWTASAGWARIEDQTPMQDCHLQYLQSVAKTYMAVAILKLYEEGKIMLDAPIATYLPESISQKVTGADTITVKMLLNHTSGIPEYNFDPNYVSKLLQSPDHVFIPEDYIDYIAGKPLDFKPGSKYSYRNTNYVLLALMADKLTGNHAKYIGEVIFKPLNLNHTFYRHNGGYLNYPELVNAYWDRHSNGTIENVSTLQRNNVACLVGDDGIVTTPAEAVLFLKGLMEGKLLKPETMDLMQTWVTRENGEPAYGLGLSYRKYGDHVAYGHSGGGIGAGCELNYFPDKNLYVFIAINIGTVTASPLHEGLGVVREKIYTDILQ